MYPTTAEYNQGNTVCVVNVLRLRTKQGCQKKPAPSRHIPSVWRQILTWMPRRQSKNATVKPDPTIIAIAPALPRQTRWGAYGLDRGGPCDSMQPACLTCGLTLLELNFKFCIVFSIGKSDRVLKGLRRRESNHFRTSEIPLQQENRSVTYKHFTKLLAKSV